MIAFLQGTTHLKMDRSMVLMTQGVGYLVSVGNDILSAVQEQEEISLFIYTQVKQDDICLYGFREAGELQFFKQLMSVSGIGAKTAMTILDMPINLTQKAIAEEDVSFLSKIPGLGKKTAARLSLELKGKVDANQWANVDSGNVPRSLQEEALEALSALGYEKHRIIRFLNETQVAYDSAEDLVKGFLQQA
jgi:Holliday junction DNA helicase RuvA